MVPRMNMLRVALTVVSILLLSPVVTCIGRPTSSTLYGRRSGSCSGSSTCAIDIRPGGGTGNGDFSSRDSPRPETSLQILRALHLLHGPLCLLAPSISARLYNTIIPSGDVLALYLMRHCGTLILGLGILSLLVPKTSTEKAVAISNVFVAINAVGNPLVGFPGFSPGPVFLGTVMAVVGTVLPLLAYHYHVGERAATNYLKAYMSFGILNGLTGVLAPDWLVQPWKFDILTTLPSRRTLLQTACTWLVGYCVCCNMLLFRSRGGSGSSLVKAVGWGSLPAPAYVLLVAGTKNPWMLFWLVPMLLLLAPMLL